jgi:hypothetical protein
MCLPVSIGRATDLPVRVDLRLVAERTRIARERLSIGAPYGAATARATQTARGKDDTNGHHAHDQRDGGDAQQYQTHCVLPGAP